MSKVRTILAAAFAAMTVAVSMAQLDDYVYVRGYYRLDGTYVRPHYRTRPDGYFWNNWSSYGNINPFTGERGYRLPSYDWVYRLPSYDYGISRLPSPSYGSLYHISPLSSYSLPSLTPSRHRYRSLLDW
jgi:hypothetical protein